MNLEDKILQKIKEEKIEPKPFWYFLARDYTLWVLVFLSIILAAVSIAPIIFILQNIELGYIKHISDNYFLFILHFLPYSWLLLCGFTTFLATLAWEKTAHGYRISGWQIFIYSFLISLILGLILNIWSMGRFMDKEFKFVSMGNYESFEERRNQFWFNPGGGRILGLVQDVSSTSFFIYNEDNNFVKEILFDDQVFGINNIIDGKNVRIVGFEINSSTTPEFIACAIFPDELGNGKFDIRKKLREKGTNTRGKAFEKITEIHEECKNIFENGRALFRPKHFEIILK